jgi:hypothetical protein
MFQRRLLVQRSKRADVTIVYEVHAWDGGEARLTSRAEREDHAIGIATAFMQRHAPVVAYSAFVQIVRLPIRAPVARWNADASKNWVGGARC